MQNVIQSMVLKQLFFKKLQKIAQRLGDSPSDPLNDTFELQYTFLLNTSLNLDIPTLQLLV